MNNFNKKIFTVIYWIVISLSGLSLLLVHISIFTNNNLSISFNGIIGYLNYFIKLQSLLGLAITLIIARIALNNWELAVKNNQEKNFQDSYNDWKPIISQLLSTIEKKDPKIVEIFPSKQKLFFRILMKYNFKVDNEQQLIEVFKVFKNVIYIFEEFNSKYQAIGSLYNSKNQSYSLESFKYLFINSIETKYPDIIKDLDKLYLECLPEDRHIDASLYKRKINERPLLSE